MHDIGQRWRNHSIAKPRSYSASIVFICAQKIMELLITKAKIELKKTFVRFFCWFWSENCSSSSFCVYRDVKNLLKLFFELPLKPQLNTETFWQVPICSWNTYSHSNVGPSKGSLPKNQHTWLPTTQIFQLCRNVCFTVRVVQYSFPDPSFPPFLCGGRS